MDSTFSCEIHDRVKDGTAFHDGVSVEQISNPELDVVAPWM